MGRSKFPGKPCKHTNRKRVNVLPSNGEACNIDSCSSLTVDSVVENKQDEDVKEKENGTGMDVVNKKVTIKRRLTRKMQTSIRNKTTTKRSLLTKMTKQQRGNKLTHKTVRFNITPKETNSLVGKFVLPTRSVHSSRVIKPNKRFINVDLNDTVTIKRNVKRHCIKQDDDKIKTHKTPPTNKCVNGENNNSDKPLLQSGRIVLRQARLKLHSQTPTGPEGPFTSTATTCSPPGTVTCGVCGAVRFYRFVKQARKFNIYSCESCRKFISKMIKRQSCGKNLTSTLVCHKGQGMCHVPPIVRSQQWKLIRCAYRARCPACWLKMCLRSFQMPISLKHSLSQLLPKNMQTPDIIFNNTSLWQTNVQRTEFLDNKTTNIIDNNDNTTIVKQRPVRFKNPKPLNTIPSQPTDIKRQKIDLKGPRVKHVCRSASIVLGQPLATFSDEKKVINEQQPLQETKICEEKTVTVNKSEPNLSYSENESSDCDKLSKIIDSNMKRERNMKMISSQNYAEKVNQERKKPLVDCHNGISIDYWEGYDPDDICQNGFCLIASEHFPMASICFLCGSGGREPLLYCSLCCEPYHTFCLEQIPSSLTNNRQSIWLCPRCTTCAECNQADRTKINCQKCLKSYHPECFNKKWNSDDIPTVCAKCLRCKSCSNENITKFVGNIPLCMVCFKLRKKGNFCPVCQHCYDDNECCSKMMECAKCNKWVHAKCEQLSEEQYQILSVLPESIEYFCKLCCSDPQPQWKQAIDIELQASFKYIIKLLSKNKIARNILKWSPLNNHTPLNKTITNAKKIQFTEDDIDIDNNNTAKDLIDINKIYSFEENEKFDNDNKIPCPAIVDIKNKLNSNEFCSVKEFHVEMEKALKYTQSEQLLKIYEKIFHSIFPWYETNQNYQDTTKIVEKHQNKIICDTKTTQVDCNVVDQRICSFCKMIGDGLSYEESRLLYCGQNEWVHANCALWSSEVYEEIDGSLQQVQNALNRGRLIRCSFCKQKGASVGCCFKGCYETFHFPCARMVKCQFLHDKTVYCSTHQLPNDCNLLTNPKEFDIHRSVYVELDKKKRRYADIDKVNFMVGSLRVTNLGKIHPSISDTTDAIIPMGFICTRLFWSTIEPWKLIPYNITTSILNSNTNVLQIDKNFTVDHSLPKTVVDKMFREISLYHDKKKADLIEFDDDEEPQNSTDFLSPELTDAILEELPNDLLDGISVQDIFPKFCDDLINMDFKSDNNDDKKCELDEEFENNRELRRTKSEKFDSITKSRVQQRSCSLTVSCKVDRSLSPALKKRKIQNSHDNLFFHLGVLQVDGNFDDSSSSECDSPTKLNTINPWNEEPVTCEKCQRTYRTQASYKRHLDTCDVICSSESDSEVIPDEEIVDNSTNENQPVVLTSFESIQNEIHHTSVQTFVAQQIEQQKNVIQLPIQTEQEQFTVNPLINDQTQFCVNQTVPLCVNQPLTIQPIMNQTVDFQPQSVTIQSVPFTNNVTPIITQQNQFSSKLLVNPLIQTVNVPNQWITKVKQPQKAIKRKKTIIKRQFENDVILPQNSGTSVIVQQLPSTNFVPFVETQNVQYVIPQQTQPLLQIQPENNLISLVSPTMIIQQPRILENQLVLDSNGSLGWTTPQVQPVYYGFETIVQNTVMQSQQFLPTTVPGVLTANSSYSTTTQVFQTSKLEPVLDSYVLVNPLIQNSQQIEPNYQQQQPQQPRINIISQPQTSQPVKYSTNVQQNCINLPTAPFIQQDQGIPTNVVVPTPKPQVPIQSRPMNRVLPMQNIVKEQKKNVEEIKKVFYEDKIQPTIVDEIKIQPQQIVEKKIEPIKVVEKKIIKPVLKTVEENKIVDIQQPPVQIEIKKLPTIVNKTIEKENKLKTDTSLKLIFQKQSQDGTYKISNNFTTKQPQVAPLKPIKSSVNSNILQSTDKQNRLLDEEKLENTDILKQTSNNTSSKKENDNMPSILYTIETQDGFKYSSTSISDLWDKVFQAVQNARNSHNMPPLPNNTNLFNNVQILGFKSNGLKHLIEQLPGASKCHKYKPMFNFPPHSGDVEDEYFSGHCFGAIRCSSYQSKGTETYDMFGWLSSKHRKPEEVSFDTLELLPRRGSINNLPMAMRFRQLKLTSKYSVGVYRSSIHGRGLFCLRDIEAGEMVIEYAGEVIRSILTDKREKYYNTKGIGCYMFRVDDNFVVDATMKGNAARFINHSCEPNCYSKVVEILGHKHIIIFALRRILSGEELTYDYKFPFEEDKIPCTCGSRKCRKFLN